MPNVVSNTLHFSVERWDDPGVYPSGAGGGPLPSYDYALVEGELTLDGPADDEFLGSFVPPGFHVTSWLQEGNTYIPADVELKFENVY